MKYFFFLCCFVFTDKLYAHTNGAEPRIVINMNKAWSFTKDAYNATISSSNKQVHWQPVHLPHTWNVIDVMDDTPGYYRGVCWYKKSFTVDGAWQAKDIFFYFEGANQQTEVFINGIKAGNHIGGYTAFYIPVSKLLKFDNKENMNEVVVKVDNSYNEAIPPLTADFTFYGGIYRNVSLVAINKVHFTCKDYASKGVYITTPVVSKEEANVHLRGTVSGNSFAGKRINIHTAVLDRDKKMIAETSTSLPLKPGVELHFEQEIQQIKRPHLWSPEDPYLYTVVTQLVDAASGDLLDQVTNPLGFRWVKFDADKGFFLNGMPYKLIGTSRHQDYKGLGNAVPKELAKQDVQLLKEMGGNFLRIAHYPQDACVLEACDSLGILTSVEIPVVNEITESEAFYQNCRTMQVEMIRQNFNHPSIIMWCYMNEVLLRPHFANDKARQQQYFVNIRKLAQSLDSISRKEDPYRYTMLACHGDFNKYKDVGLTAIPMVVGWNLYSGWYGAKMEDFPAFLDHHHKELPGKPLMVTEYGADADPRIRSASPVRFDKSVEYTTAFHQYYLKQMMQRPFVAGAVVWNLADFNSETREETMPHINNKGLLMWDRTPKDIYYYYKAVLQKEPVVKIASSYWKWRGGIANGNDTVCYQALEAASNLDSLQLVANGKSIGKQLVKDGWCEWIIPFKNGANSIKISGWKDGKEYADSATINFQLQPYYLNSGTVPFKQINILLGARRSFEDEHLHQFWLPDQPYLPGSWGAVGGKPFIMANNNRLPYGTDKNIIHTDNDPVYQTQRTGIEGYKLDVPAGRYELTLHFAELSGGTTKALVYNLSDSEKQEGSSQRIFNVFVNDSLLLQNFDIAKQYGVAKAVVKTMEVSVPADKGIHISFEAITGEPVLNALQLRKLN